MAHITKIPWWQWLPVFGWRVVMVVDSADEIPQKLPRNSAVLVGSSTRPKWVVFDCPCRSGHRIMLNTDSARSPRWSTTVTGPLTISPSVDYNHPVRRCHYFVRNGRIEWVHDKEIR